MVHVVFCTHYTFSCGPVLTFLSLSLSLSLSRPADPYAMPVHDEDVPRPPTVKADDLKNMELVDDEDGGWAGHHEEVDYSKEVIFSDSSDDEATPKDRHKVGEDIIVNVHRLGK